MAWDETRVLRDDRGRFAGSVGQNGELTDQQKIELQDYKEGNYRDLNGYLRDPAGVRESLGQEYEKQAKAIDAAIQKSTLQEDTIVFRGMQHPALAKNAEKVIGRQIEAPTFLSTSTKGSVARDFAGVSGAGIVLAIKAKKGMHAAYMDQFETSGNSGESELLFGRGHKISITGVDRSRRPMIITAEFVT